MMLVGSGPMILFFLFCLICDSDGLKCRTGEETQTNEDFEYVVRMCLRQMKNTSRYDNFERNFQNMFDSGRKDRNSMQNKNRNSNNNRNQDNDGFEYFWNPNSGRDRDKDRDQKGNNDRGSNNDYMEDSDYFHSNPLRGMGTENQAKIRPRPHSYQQQVQHDRDNNYGYGHRDGPSGFMNGDRNKNSKRTSNRKGESPLEQLDACMIHCIFQEMQMLDENGKPDKNTVSEKMSQKIRNPELKSFIQDSVEDCFDSVEEESDNNRVRGGDNMCVWSKNFAICLEEKGKEACDDWNEPVRRNTNNKNKEDQKNKNTKGGNNRG